MRDEAESNYKRRFARTKENQEFMDNLPTFMDGERNFVDALRETNGEAGAQAARDAMKWMSDDPTTSKPIQVSGVSELSVVVDHVAGVLTTHVH